MIGDLARLALAENMAQKSQKRRAMVHLKGLPLNKNDNPMINHDVYYTDMIYFVQYSSNSRRGYIDEYKIHTDLVNGGTIWIREKNGEIKLKKEEQEAALKWLLKYTNLNLELLKIAKGNPLMKIPIAFDIIEYDKMLRAQIEGEPLTVIDTDNWWIKCDYYGRKEERKILSNWENSLDIDIKEVGKYRTVLMKEKEKKE